MYGHTLTIGRTDVTVLDTETPGVSRYVVRITRRHDSFTIEHRAPSLFDISSWLLRLDPELLVAPVSVQGCACGAFLGLARTEGAPGGLSHIMCVECAEKYNRMIDSFIHKGE